MEIKKNNTPGPGGARKGAGRPTNKELGLEKLKVASCRVEGKVINLCKEKHGSIANALRYAAQAKTETP